MNRKKSKLYQLPKLGDMEDLRKYLMIIETMELQKLENAVCVKTKMKDQKGTVANLKMIKEYYGQMTDFIQEQQRASREDELEQAFMKELSRFTRFWEGTMARFRQVSREEMENLLKKNSDLSNEVCEIMEKVFGFRPPPDRIYNDLLFIRKVALRLRTDDTVQYLNFDYFTKRNIEINKKWVKDRKHLLIKLLTSFDNRLAKRTEILKQKLKKELDRLHYKRQNQFDRLNTKYIRCKNLMEQVNAKEKTKFNKDKEYFHIRSDVPRLKIRTPKPRPGVNQIRKSELAGTQGSYNQTILGTGIGSVHNGSVARTRKTASKA